MPRKPSAKPPAPPASCAPIPITAPVPDPAQMEFADDPLPYLWPETIAESRAPFESATTRTLMQTEGTGRINPPGPVLQPLPAMPLFEIDRELTELLALREEIDADASTHGPADADELLLNESRVAIDTRIQQYIAAHLRKVDSIAHVIREFTARADVASAESVRLSKRAASWKSQAQRLKDYVLQFMTRATPPITHVESPTNRLRTQASGGVVALDVYAPADVPAELKRYAVALTQEQLLTLCSWAQAVEDDAMLSLLEHARGTPDAEAIRSALAQHVVCPACNGVLDVINGCEKCANKGTVPREVPGARLQERGVHLRVE